MITNTGVLNASLATYEDERLMFKRCNLRLMNTNFLFIETNERVWSEDSLYTLNILLKIEDTQTAIHKKLGKLGFSEDDRKYVINNIDRLTAFENVRLQQAIRRGKANKREYNYLKIRINNQISEEFTDCVEQAFKIALILLIKLAIRQDLIMKAEQDRNLRSYVKKMLNVLITEMLYISY